MFNWSRINTLVLASAILAIAPSAPAGGILEALDFTKQPSSIAGEVIVRPVPSRWSARCLPVRWRVNAVDDPILNPANARPVSLAEIIVAVKRALKTWNDVPTSYIRMQFAGTVSNPLDAEFDMVNEVHFGDSFFGTRARLIRLVEDTTLVDGDDLNDDGIPDVSSNFSSCHDVGGRTVFPPGFYKAGTILEADMLWDTSSHPLAVRDEDLANTRVFDFQGVATHEFGHALGLAHSLNTQRSPRDGRDALMGGSYATDFVFKRMQRTLDSDDIAWVSYLYPEGSASTGPAALQAGDVAFTSRYGLISGSLRHGRENLPIPGGVVDARDLHSREIVASGYTGTIRLSGDPVTGEVRFLPPEEGIVNGRFVIPLPTGSYSLSVRPTGLPPYPISYTNDAGALYGLLDFHEEGVDRHDDEVEYKPGEVNPFRVLAGRNTSGVGIVTNRTIDVTGVGLYNTSAVAGVETPEGIVPYRYAAVRIRAARYAELTQSRSMPILEALFLTRPADPSAVQRFPGAMLTTGTVNSDGTASVDLATPLVRIGPFTSRDYQLTPIYFEDSRTLGARVSSAIARGQISDLFLVLALPSPPYPAPGRRPPLIGRSCSGEPATNSYYTTDGTTFVPLPFCDLVFSLIVAEPLR